MIEFDKVSIVFGSDPRSALPLMDQGKTRAEIQRTLRAGARRPRLHADGQPRRDLGADGPLGLGQVDAAARRQRPQPGDPRPGAGAQQEGRDGRRGDRGRPSRCATSAAARSSMVFQQFALLPWRSVVENVALGLELAGEPKEKRLAKAREVLATVNLTDWAEKKVSELSGGMQQRVGLARAFATDAEILLMDEPFSALDPLIRNRLQDELLQLQDEDALHDRLRLPRPRGGGEARQHHHHHGGRADRRRPARPRTSCCGRPTATSPTSSPTSTR